MNVNFHIDRIVLRGLPISGRNIPCLEAALRAEIVAQLNTGGYGASLAGGLLTRMRTQPLTMEPGTAPARLGRQIADNLCGALRTR